MATLGGVDIPPELHAVIESGPLVHLSTLNADGSPQVSVVWVGFDGGDLVTAHMSARLKVRNLQRDARAVLSFLAPTEPGALLHRYAVLRSRATVEPSDRAWDVLNRLMKVYVSADATFPAPPGPGFLVRYAVDRITGVGPWVPSAH
ncbi:MAG TPA: PPOX class F420-dependent oxidoreductase [Pseudonocardia sp.]